ncbi:peptide transport periplasmic protein [Klebsiella pneumoniae]|uniref:Peptide transport periplasmic protein n=1 Tax=Klebsiella pneumoniae TaxID=573 RepID=A0A4P0XZX9_KLEPN|nr:peptide transport periplasmic protein [Klebsiella pneumoniae]
MPMTSFLPLAVFNRDHPWHNVNGSSFPYFDSLQFADSVESVRKLDNQTVGVRLKRPDASFLWHLATHYASITSGRICRPLNAGRPPGATGSPAGLAPARSSYPITAPDNMFACSATPATGAANR